MCYMNQTNTPKNFTAINGYIKKETFLETQKQGFLNT